MSERTLGSLQVAALLVSPGCAHRLPLRLGRDGAHARHGGQHLWRGNGCRHAGAGLVRQPAVAGGLADLGVVRPCLRPAAAKRRRIAVHRMDGGRACRSDPGSLAVVGLLGLSGPVAYGMVLTLIYIASRLDLHFASGLFAACLVASGLVLVYALVAADGVPIYASAVPAFVQDLSSFNQQGCWRWYSPSASWSAQARTTTSSCWLPAAPARPPSAASWPASVCC